MHAIEALSRDTSSPRLAVSRNCNRTFVSCCIMNDTTYLYDALGRRLYLTSGEREAFFRTALGHDRPVRTLCSLLYYTGCRLSEALHVTPRRVDFADRVIIVESLKKRRKGVYRAIPVPPALLDTLDMVHGLTEIQRRNSRRELEQPLWSWSRTTAWRRVVAVMKQADITEGPHPRSQGPAPWLRHSRLKQGRPPQYALEVDGPLHHGNYRHLCERCRRRAAGHCRPHVVVS
jgi:integrase/recombinase XerD